MLYMPSLSASTAIIGEVKLTPCDIEAILLAIVANVALDEVATPLPVIAFAINVLPLLTDVFKLSISVDALH